MQKGWMDGQWTDGYLRPDWFLDHLIDTSDPLGAPALSQSWSNGQEREIDSNQMCPVDQPEEKIVKLKKENQKRKS